LAAFSGESSSVWIEHWIVVPRVAGSNPVFHPVFVCTRSW
jgi:hypothetical protein